MIWAATVQRECGTVCFFLNVKKSSLSVSADHAAFISSSRFGMTVSSRHEGCREACRMTHERDVRLYMSYGTRRPQCRQSDSTALPR